MQKRYYTETLSLAFPVILSNVGQAVVGLADNIMVGQLGAVPLAAASFANIVVNNVLVFGMGMAYGLTPLVGQEFARARLRRTAELFQNSLSLNLVTALLLTLLLLLLIPLFPYFKQPEEVIALSHNYYLIVTASILPYMLFLSFKQFLEGMENTRAAMVITIAANLLNILLNYLLIYGKGGMPRMGIDGAAVATFISRLLMPVAFYLYVRSSPIYSRFFRFFSRKSFSVRLHRTLLSVGFPISGQMIIEFLALSVTAVMMGWIGAEAMAANQIVLSLISTMFMVVSGIAGAVTILVSRESGLGNARSVVRYTVAGVRMSISFMAVAAVIFVVGGKMIAGWFTPDPLVVEYAGMMFSIAALFEICDGIQVTVLGGLRGMTDVKRPMYYALFSYLLINVSAAYFFGFILDWGGQGVWIGFLCGLSTAAVLYFRRFFYKVRRLRAWR